MDLVAVILAFTHLLAPASAASSSCDIGQYWIQIPGSLSWLSSGDAGVWGVNSAGSIFYRVGSRVGLSYTSGDGRYYGFSHDDGSSWVQVSGSLRQIDVGKDVVWGAASGGAYRRYGISSRNPIGVGWRYIGGLNASHVSVSDTDGKVWAVEAGTGRVYRRVGLSDEDSEGINWEWVPGITARYVDVGGAGVLATSPNGDVYYRVGSRHDSQGSLWKWIDYPDGPDPMGLNGPLLKIKQASSGGDTVWVVTASGSVYFRLNVTSADATGQSWIQVPGSLAQISVSTSNNAVWGVDADGRIYSRHQ